MLCEALSSKGFVMLLLLTHLSLLALSHFHFPFSIHLKSIPIAHMVGTVLFYIKKLRHRKVK